MSQAPTLHEFAHAILFGDRLEDKLVGLAPGALATAQAQLSAPRVSSDVLALADAPNTASSSPALAHIPRFPGRPTRLARIGKAEFPRLESLARDPVARGQVLHFFANHELLAMELMALMILRFPNAPQAFVQGLARTITEEQSHMRLYIARMRELGVEFGDLPLSDYFWNAIKDAPSPLVFVTQMSLTLEQANLDYSLFYRDAVRRAGDEETARILERVYQEEIGHVKHGVHWFNRWRADARTDDRVDATAAGEAAQAASEIHITSSPAPAASVATTSSDSDSAIRVSPPESDWDAFLRLLPPPMTPRRARGLGFAAQARRQAGLSERFISELEIYGGSKGRPPVLWHYNPLCDAEIARGKPGFSPTGPMRKVMQDVEPLLMNLANEQDVILVSGRAPSAPWLKRMRELGFTVPEFRAANQVAAQANAQNDAQAHAPPRESKLGGVEPWGWSPESFARFKPSADRLIAIEGANGAWAKRLLLDHADFAATGLSKFFSKEWSATFLKRWLESLTPAASSSLCPPTAVARIHRDWASLRDDILRFLAERQRERPSPEAGHDSDVEHLKARPVPALLAKAPYGTSGIQNKRIFDPVELEGSLGGWIRGVLDSQGAILLEPWLDKVAELSIQFVVHTGKTELLGVRRFFTGPQLEYRGTDLDPRLTSLGPDALRFLHSPPGPSGGPSPLEHLKQLARDVGHELSRGGYEGPAGIDAILYKDPQGSFKLKPLSELNPRWTMGRIALAIENRVLPGVPARWHWVSRRELPPDTDFASWAARLERSHPIRLSRAGDGMRISEGIAFTTDPASASEVLTLLAVGSAVQALSPQCPERVSDGPQQAPHTRST
jgi:uncharacterized ferritin-like protein (DUF455 family)